METGESPGEAHGLVSLTGEVSVDTQGSSDPHMYTCAHTNEHTKQEVKLLFELLLWF